MSRSDYTILMMGLKSQDAVQVRRICGEYEVAVIEPDSLDGHEREQRQAVILCICDIGLFEVIHRWDAGLPVVLVSEVADSRHTIDVMKRGAIECLLSPVKQSDLRRQIEQAMYHADTGPFIKPGRMVVAGSDDGIIGQSSAMLHVYKLLGQAAPKAVNILITGESGTGKELIARAIHSHSPRHDKPFLAVNCAAIPETLLESEMFGHEKGAFTGADKSRAGKFEQSDGGTLLLDEIGDMPLSIQAKLLRVLQDNSFYRLGSSKSMQCDVRVIAATHQDLDELVARKAFRQDLYYRLKVVSIHLPSLREREIDSVLLAHYFVDQLNIEFNTDIRSFSPEAVTALLAYPWPGNIRELENVIKSSLLSARGKVFLVDFLPDHIRRYSPGTPTQPASKSHADHATDLEIWIDHLLSDGSSAGRLHQRGIELFERQLIIAALNRKRGMLGETSKLLGISRTTLRSRIQRYRISLQPYASAGNESDES